MLRCRRRAGPGRPHVCGRAAASVVQTFRMRLHRSSRQVFSMPRRRRGSVLRFLVILLAVAVLAPVLAALGALLFVDPDAWRLQVEAAAQRASGRAVHIGG